MKGLALVTGAGAGLGLALATGLAQRGYGLLLVSLPGEGLPETAGKLSNQFHIQCHFLEGDLTQQACCDQVLQAVLSTGQPLQVFVNNAGLGSTSPFLEMSPEFYHRQMTLNAVIPVVLMRMLLPLLAGKPETYVLMISSMGAFLHIPGKAAYNASKASLLHFSESLRPVLEQQGIHICVSCPGPINTNARLREAHAGLKGIGKKLVMEPSAVADASLEAVFNKKKRIIPGGWNRLMFRLQQLMPASWKQALLQQRFRG